MLLALDVGNTNIVVGCMEGKTPLRAFRLATRRDSTGGDYAAAISQLLELAGIAFFAADFVGVWNLLLFVGGLPAILVGALVLCLALLFLGCTFYIWPLLAVFDFPLKKLLSNSFIMAVGNLPFTLTLALLWALAGVGCYYMSGVFFVWVGLAIFASSYFINTVFKKYTGELAEEQAAWEQAERERKQRKKLQKNGML